MCQLSYIVGGAQAGQRIRKEVEPAEGNQYAAFWQLVPGEK